MHGPRDTQLKEDAHRYLEVNGVQIMSTLRSLAMNGLRLDGFGSITDRLAALAHDIRESWSSRAGKKLLSHRLLGNF